jgi:zinc transport system permease protein
MIEAFSYGFMQKAFVTGIFAAIACSLLGTFLVLRRYALIGDGIAHISFGGVATGLLFGIAPFFSALIFSLIGSLGILKLRERAGLHGDSAIGIVSHTGLGIGIFIASAARGFNVDILSYLFGSILAIKGSEMVLSIALAIIIIGAVILFYNDLFFMTFDEEIARASGLRAEVLNTMLVLLTAATVIVSMRVVGLLLASALIIIPASSALQLRKSFKATLIVAGLLASSSVVIGLLLAYYGDFAPSGSIVMVNAVLFLVMLSVGKLRH